MADAFDVATYPRRRHRRASTLAPTFSLRTASSSSVSLMIWEGDVAAQQVVAVASALAAMCRGELSLRDTIGVATPGQVVTPLERLGEQDIGSERLAVHFHDTFGQALANTIVALQYGITTVDSSAGGLGGCPYAGSATGNLATEGLVWQLDGLGIETGVDLEALCRTSMWMANLLGRRSPSRTVTALASSLEG